MHSAYSAAAITAAVSLCEISSIANEQTFYEFERKMMMKNEPLEEKGHVKKCASEVGRTRKMKFD